MRPRFTLPQSLFLAAPLLSLGLGLASCAGTADETVEGSDTDVVETEPPSREDYSQLSVEDREDLLIEWMGNTIAPAKKALRRYAEGTASQQQALERAALASERILLAAGPLRWEDVPDFAVHARACAEEFDELRAYAAAGDQTKLLAAMEQGAPFSCKRCHDAVEEVR